MTLRLRIHRLLLLILSCIVVVYFELLQPLHCPVGAALRDAVQHHPQQRHFVPEIMTKIMNNNSNEESSTVLQELKETIRQQAAEIDNLRRQLKGIGSTTTTTPSITATTRKSFTVPINLHGGGGGSSSNVALDEITQYIHRPFYEIASQRVGWLGLFMISLSFTAIIMSEFEHILSQEVELAFFVPFLAGHGGNTGGQAVGTVLSALSAGVVTIKDAPKVIVKEAMSGLSMGIILGSIVGP